MFCVFAISCCSCRRVLDKQEYVRYIKDEQNGLSKQISVGEWVYMFQYKPIEYILLLENNEKASAEENKRREMLNGSVWFNISFKRASNDVSPLRYGIGSPDEYEQRLMYFLNNAHKEIKLIYGSGDTLSQIGYLFENNFNLTPHETMVVGFDLPGDQQYPTEDMQLCFNDRTFNNGILKVVYKKADVKQVPELKQ